jgi:hypothetical protein
VEDGKLIICVSLLGCEYGWLEKHLWIVQCQFGVLLHTEAASFSFVVIALNEVHDPFCNYSDITSEFIA